MLSNAFRNVEALFFCVKKEVRQLWIVVRVALIYVAIKKKVLGKKMMRMGQGT
jgi:hypothetical protein